GEGHPQGAGVRREVLPGPAKGPGVRHRDGGGCARCPGGPVRGPPRPPPGLLRSDGAGADPAPGGRPVRPGNPGPVQCLAGEWRANGLLGACRCRVTATPNATYRLSKLGQGVVDNGVGWVRRSRNPTRTGFWKLNPELWWPRSLA